MRSAAESGLPKPRRRAASRAEERPARFSLCTSGCPGECGEALEGGGWGGSETPPLPKRSRIRQTESVTWTEGIGEFLSDLPKHVMTPLHGEGSLFTRDRQHRDKRTVWVGTQANEGRSVRLRWACLPVSCDLTVSACLGMAPKTFSCSWKIHLAILLFQQFRFLYKNKLSRVKLKNTRK